MFVPELTTDVDVGSLGPHAKADDKGAFNKLVGVMAQDFTILAGSRLGLISVDHQVR